MTPQEIKERLEYIRAQIDKECISYAELFELESLAEYIETGDVQLLQWANVEEDN
jgi:hypothetical protein